MTLLAKFASIFDHVIDSLVYIAGGLVIIMMLSIFANVVSRELFGTSIVWVLELSQYSLCYITFLVATWLLREEGHVKMDLVLNRLKAAHQAALNAATSIIGALLSLITFWYGMLTTWDMFQRGAFLPESLLKTPVGPLLAIIPVAGFLLFIQFLRRAVGYLVSQKAATQL